MIQAVVFDLDGTLADTAEITIGVRLPSHVLNLSKPWESNPSLLMHGELRRQINLLISSGIAIYVITRAPKPYASTLVFLLNIDFHRLIPHSNRFQSVESKLQYIIESEELTPDQILYVGNEATDELSARKVGIYYQAIDEVFGMSDNYRTHLQDKIKLCETADISDSKSAKIIAEKQQKNISNVVELIEKVENDTTLSEFELSQVFCSNLYDHEFLRSDILKPFINPSFISRYEYDNDYGVRKRLFELVVKLGFTCKLIETPFDIPKDFDEVPVYSHYKYDDVSHWWIHIKDWKWPDSGPKVELHHLEFIALTMAAFLVTMDFPIVIVPIPPSKFSKDKPSETSLRLAYRVSQLSGVPIFDIFKKDSNDNIYSEYTDVKFERTVILLDDQLTKGKSAIKCLNILAEMGVDDVRLHTWTSKEFNVVEEYK
jgi:hypothetical protein